KESPLPELPIQYADYAEWQRENLQGEVLEEQLEYWRKQLGGELPVVELPGDHVRPAVRSYRGAQQELRVSREVTEKLKQVSQKEGATLFMTLLAAFDVLLARYRVEGSEEEIDRQEAKLELRVTMWEREEGLTGVVEYSTDLFEAGTMERLVGHWERLLEGIAEDAQQRVWELPLLGEAERRQVVEEWNQTEGWYPRDKTIVELVEEQVEKTPARGAVVYEGESLSYGELNRRANQLARRLRGWGGGPEQLVGLCMKRSLEMVVGLMGVLKAGGAYVPLEPDYPRERLEFMVRDTGLKVVLSEERNRKAVEGEGLRVLSLDTEWGEVAAESGEGVESGVQPENLAYVIYTSGST